MPPPGVDRVGAVSTPQRRRVRSKEANVSKSPDRPLRLRGCALRDRRAVAAGLELPLPPVPALDRPLHGRHQLRVRRLHVDRGRDAPLALSRRRSRTWPTGPAGSAAARCSGAWWSRPPRRPVRPDPLHVDLRRHPGPPDRVADRAGHLLRPTPATTTPSNPNIENRPNGSSRPAGSRLPAGRDGTARRAAVACRDGGPVDRTCLCAAALPGPRTSGGHRSGGPGPVAQEHRRPPAVGAGAPSAPWSRRHRERSLPARSGA